ncbi:hypothetical protein Tco_1163489 [Tanacetum coccineum]
MIRTESGRMITKNIDDMTIAEYMEYEAEMRRDPWKYTRNLGLTTIGGTKSVQFRRTSLTGFPAQSIRSSNAIALDSPYLLVLITGTSQSRQHESRKSPTKSLFDVGSRRISIVTVNTKEYHSDVLAIITRIMRRTY